MFFFLLFCFVSFVCLFLFCFCFFCLFFFVGYNMIQDPVNGRLLVLYIHILWFQVFLLLLFVPEEGCDLCAGRRLRSLCRRKAAIFAYGTPWRLTVYPNRHNLHAVQLYKIALKNVVQQSFIHYGQYSKLWTNKLCNMQFLWGRFIYWI